MDYATIQDLETLWRHLDARERSRAGALLPLITSTLRAEAKRRGHDLDAMVTDDEDLRQAARSVTVDVCARVLMTSTNQEPVSQASESAPDYSWSATYLVPGGGLYIKKAELARLGLTRQRYGTIELYGSREGG